MARIVLAVWAFVVGDDWRLAAGAALIIGGAALLVAIGANAWWFAPGAVALVLAGSVGHAARRGRR